MKVTLDWETANQDQSVDLSEMGAWAYFEHSRTEVLCLVAISDDGGHFPWVPGTNDALFLSMLTAWAEDPTVIFEAHGAGFEQAGWEYVLVRRYGLPRLPPERWDCTMARCYYRGLPGGLDLAARVLGLSEQKDVEGSKITLSLSKPMTQVAWMEQQPEDVPVKAEWKRRYPENHFDRSPKTIRRVVAYCHQDVVTEIALSKAVGPLSPYERKVWELDQRINQRGLKIDLDYVRACQAVVAEASKPLRAEFERLTGGLEVTQVKALTEWCNANGLKIDSLAKDKLKAIGITGVDEEEDDDFHMPSAKPVPARVRRVLEIRAVLGSSSITKLDRMLRSVNSDGRVRYTQQYHGAHTGRTAGRLIQPTNFPRSKIEEGHDPSALVRAIMVAQESPALACEIIGALYGDPIAAVASGLRHAIVAGDGCLFDTGDFAGIEARGVLALAGAHDKCSLIAGGMSPYLDFGAMMFKRPISKNNLADYMPAKGGVLGCGFGCGAENFNNKFLGGSDLPMAKKVVDTYRKEWAPEVPKLWYGLEAAALKAVRDQGRAEAYGVVYQWTPGWLACVLPDGQTMWYFRPELCSRAMPWDEFDVRDGWSYWCMQTGVWKKVYAYGGSLCENVVQKLARGWLVAASYRLEENGFPLVLTVYDECMSEVPAIYADQKAYEQIMAEPTPYAQSIRVPIEVEGWESDRYRK